MNGNRPSQTRAVLLVDSDAAGDRRVRRWQQRLAAAGATAEIVDIRSVPAGPALARATLALAALGRGIAAAHRLAPRLRGRVARNPFAGLRPVWRWLGHATGAAQALRPAANAGVPCTVVSNDLYCGVAACVADRLRATRIVYDSHELQAHRHRRAGWLRVLIEHGLERRVVSRADELHVVNRAIANVMTEWHGALPPAVIDLNDHYAHHDAPNPPSAVRPSLVYVGMGMRGRWLQRLAEPAEMRGFDVRLYPLGASPPDMAPGPDWTFGPIDYEADLLAWTRARRCLMWCCLEPRSLSYELATPNKFFQALAVGIPIVASRGTYVGELVAAHGIGALLDDEPLAALALRVQSEAYRRWVEAVLRLRAAMRDGSVRL